MYGAHGVPLDRPEQPPAGTETQEDAARVRKIVEDWLDEGVAQPGEPRFYERRFLGGMRQRSKREALALLVRLMEPSQS